MGAIALAALLCASSASPQETRYVWSGVTIHEGKKSGRAVSTFDEATARKARADAHAQGFLKELAEVRLRIDVDRKLEEALKALEDLHIRAAWALDYDGRMDVLVQVAQLRADLFAALGRKDEALRAASSLLLDESVKKSAPDYELVTADEKTLQDEKKSIDDARLVGVRKRLVPGSSPGEISKPLDEIESAVYLAFQQQRPQLVIDIGPRAVPALEKMVLWKLDEFPSVVEQDPLRVLIIVAEMRGARLALDHYDGGGFFWKKRILRAMKRCEVLGPDPEVVAPPGGKRQVVRLEPIWLTLLAKLLDDPQIGRETLGLVEIAASHGALTPELQQALCRALDAGDPDMAKGIVQALGDNAWRGSAKPVLERMLRSPLENVRHYGAEQMLNYDSSEAMLACAEHEDPFMRRQLAIFLRSHNTSHDPGKWINPKIGPAERDVLGRLVADSDAGLRSEAVASITRLDPPLEPAIYERLAGDKDPAVLAAVDRALSILARTPRFRGLWILPVFRARRANQALPLGEKLSSEDRSEMYWNLLSTKAGVETVFGWALGEGDDKLLEIAVRHLTVDASSPTSQEEGREAAEPGGVAALDAQTLEKVYRRIFVVSPEAFFHLHNELCSPRWGGAVRLAAMLPILKDGAAPRELRACAAKIAAIGGGDATVDAIAGLFADASWSKGEVTRYEKQSLLDVAVCLPDHERTRLILLAVRSKDIPDAPALLFLSGIRAGSDFPEEAASPALERWLRDPRLEAAEAKLWNEWTHVVALSLSRLPAQPLDEKVSTYLIRALESQSLERAAIQRIEELRWPVFLEPLGERLRKGDVLAVPAVGAYLNDRAAEILIEALASSPREDFRKACFDALESIRKYEDEKTHWAARKGGQEARDEAVAKLLPMLSDADEKIRAQAVLSLATLDAVEHLPKIVEMLKDKSAAVRQAAQQALDRLHARDAKKP
jgi:HEAT repeat protein